MAKRKRPASAVEFPLRPGERLVGLIAVNEKIHGANSAEQGQQFKQFISELPPQLVAENIVDGGKLDDAHLLACNDALTRVRSWLERPSIEGEEIAAAMGDATLFVRLWHAALTTAAWGENVKIGYRTSETNRRKVLKRHADSAPGKALRQKKIIAFVRGLASNRGNSRDDILEKTHRKFDVNPSTLKQNPSIRALLPARRRNRTR